MLFDAKNGCVRVNGDEMDYIVFGNGKRILLMLPGIGDGLKTARGMAIPFALMYRMFAGDFRVYVFSRRRHLPAGSTTRDMARDQIEAMKALGIERADVVGVSMGGMIAQWMAIDSPERVGNLALVVTSSRMNETLRDSLDAWMRFTQKNDHFGLMMDSMRRMYTDEYLNRNRWMLPLTARLGKPKSYERFNVMAQACAKHDAYDALEKVGARTLIIAGGKDRALGAEASREMAQRISGSTLNVFEEYGHTVYEEAKEFNGVLSDFLLGWEKL